MTVAAIIQARASSRRLPHKVLRLVGGVPLLAHVVLRVACARLVNTVVVATSERTDDDAVAAVAADAGALVVRGSLDDVLARFMVAAEKVDAEHIVRITGDCPLIDWSTIDQVIEGLDAFPKAASVGAGPGTGFPRGLDAEAIRIEALRELSEAAPNALEREHVSLGLHRRTTFSTIVVEPPPDLFRPLLRLCVDESADLHLIRQVHEHLGVGPLVPIEQVIELLDVNPALAATNSNVAQCND